MPEANVDLGTQANVAVGLLWPSPLETETIEALTGGLGLLSQAEPGPGLLESASESAWRAVSRPHSGEEGYKGQDQERNICPFW